MLPVGADGLHIMTVDHIGGKWVLACSCGAFGDDGRVVYYRRPALQQAIDHAAGMSTRRFVITATS